MASAWPSGQTLRGRYLCQNESRMSGARLTAGLWVSAYLNRLRLAGIAAYVIAKGDATAGAVVVKVATMDGAARLFERRLIWKQIGAFGRCWPKGARARWTPS